MKRYQCPIEAAAMEAAAQLTSTAVGPAMEASAAIHALGSGQAHEALRGLCGTAALDGVSEQARALALGAIGADTVEQLTGLGMATSIEMMGAAALPEGW